MLANHRYLIALGSNVPHPDHGRPRDVLLAAVRAIAGKGIDVCEVSPVIESHPLGPSRRRYANAAMVIESDGSPNGLLHLLKQVERDFGRRKGGQRWRARVLDLDIVLWSGGSYASRELVVPHPRFRERSFVLSPAVAIAAGWRDPVSGLTIRQLYARLTHPKVLPR